LFFLFIWITTSIKIPLSKSPNKFYSSINEMPLGDRLRNRRTNAGVSIPVDGGILTLGAYFMNITVGDQTYNVLIDTGSSNLVLPTGSSTSVPVLCNSTTCQKCVPDHPETSWSSTETCVFGPPQCNGSYCWMGITYGGGSLDGIGTLYTDKFCMGGECTTTTFGVSNNPPGGNDQGLIGFASEYNSCNPTCVPTPLDNLVADNLTENLFSLCLTGENGGTLDLGEIDPNKFYPPLNYTTLEVERWYNVILNDIAVGADLESIKVPQVLYRTTNDVIGAFVDSGTSLVLTNPYIFQALQASFESRYCHLPGICGKKSIFNGGTVNVSLVNPLIKYYPAIYFILKGQSPVEDFSLPFPATSYLLLNPSNSTYSLAIAPVSSLGVILGDVFMQNYYIVFDRQNLQLGFAFSKNCV